MSLVRNIAVITGTLGVSATIVTSNTYTYVDNAVEEIYIQTRDNDRLVDMTRFWEQYSRISETPITITEHGFEKCIIDSTDGSVLHCFEVDDSQLQGTLTNTE